MSPTPTADVSVRVAWSADAARIAEVQIRGWRRAYADLLPAPVLESLEPEAFTAQWQAALDKPRDARHRALVALERARVVGFAATAPSEDPDSSPVEDGEIVEWVIDPEEGRRGHGSRLLHACVDTLRSDHFTRATIWLTSTDDVLRDFLTQAGWAADGAHRSLDLNGDGTVTVKQVRLHTDLHAD
ncbi:MAG: GNAT family N-acetyltransferase [Nocardioidaceae bacterium]